MKLVFLGATEGVTGSNTYAEHDDLKFIVDCGLYQGSKESEEENSKEFNFDPSSLNFVLLTHSHIDHIGRLPYLVKNGFNGKIYCTRPTKEFAGIFLEDTCNLMTERAEEDNKQPLYNQNDVDKAISLIEAFDYYEEIKPSENLSFKFHDAGHILGSAIVEIKFDEKSILFSGDLGNPPVPILKDTDFIEADYVVMESTYGNRTHENPESRQSRLIQVVKESKEKNGVILMPSFALERTQEILYEFDSIIDKGLIAKTPIYLDSPLAIKAIEVYKQHTDYFDSEAKKKYSESENFFNFSCLKMIESREESIAIDQSVENKVIIAGSGMSNGGRIIFHEKRFLPEPNTTLLVIGYQVEGTLGRSLSDGKRTVHIKGEEVQVRANIETIEAYSAHADQDKLFEWAKKCAKETVFLIHGEADAKSALEKKLATINLKCIIPNQGQMVEI